MKNLIFAFVAAMMVGASGCIVVTDAAPPYDTCFSVADCDASSSVCQRIEADWPEATAINNICTRGCLDDFDCPFTDLGFRGTCLDFGGGALCYETCRGSLDCASGFDCAPIDTFAGVALVCMPR